MLSTLATTMRRSWLLVGWTTIFLVGTDLFVVSPFLPSMAQELHRSASSLTILISIFSIVYAIACPIQAYKRWSHHSKRRRKQGLESVPGLACRRELSGAHVEF